MSTRDQRETDRDNAWALLELVDDHPVVESWLRDLDRTEAAQTRRVGRRSMIAIAASILVMAAVGVTAYVHLKPLHYETRVGEQRDVLLPDGSRVTLNTNTALRVRYSKARRYIELQQGEALFAVKHDPQWPFDVSAGGTLTRALGTEFNVDMRDSSVTVSVLDGAVRVAAAKQIAAEINGRSGAIDHADLPGMSTIAAALAKGEAVEVRPGERRVTAEKADLRRIDAWRTRRLEFSDTPLREAIEEFNRYSGTRVVIGTPELESVRVSGVFRIGDADGFLFSLEQALGVKTLTSPGEVTLVRSGS